MVAEPGGAIASKRQRVLELAGTLALIRGGSDANGADADDDEPDF